MASPARTVVIAGAGIGGLTAALALARRGFRCTIVEQAERLDDTGAGVQLSPNASRVLIGLGLEAPLRAVAATPDAVVIRSASGRVLNRLPLGAGAEARYGAPYWGVHRGDLQRVLLEAAHTSEAITIRLGTRLEDYAAHERGLTVACRRGAEPADESGVALIGADGLWSQTRRRLGHHVEPRFAGRTAWRALIPAEAAAAEFRSADVQLWLGPDAHLVHYPVRGGSLINVVAIVGDRSELSGWSAPGDRAELLSRYSRWRWAESARALLAQPATWQKWALADLPPFRNRGQGPVTLIGDAAHPTLPFLAQGAALAIEDAAVLADAMARAPDDPGGAMRRYERTRRRRTAAVQRAARKNGHTYHLHGAEALVRNLALRAAGGGMLLRRYDWIYRWKPPAPDTTALHRDGADGA